MIKSGYGCVSCNYHRTKEKKEGLTRCVNSIPVRWTVFKFRTLTEMDLPKEYPHLGNPLLPVVSPGSAVSTEISPQEVQRKSTKD